MCTLHLLDFVSSIQFSRHCRKSSRQRLCPLSLCTYSFTATLGLRVEDSYGGSDFWQDAMEYARKGKVRVDELKRAGDEIQNFIGWSDPVEALSAFAQVNAQDVLLEET